jgi:hypothetical protein
MTDDLTGWLRSQLDEDERDARLADTGQRWEAITDRAASGPEVRVGSEDIDNPGPEWSREVNYQMWHCDDEMDGCPEAARGWRAEARHIVRHDPARVLREVEAKRRILDLHARDHECSIYSDYRPGEIDSCGYVLDGDCSTVRLLALPYSDRPGYRDEWRPT